MIHMRCVSFSSRYPANMLVEVINTKYINIIYRNVNYAQSMHNDYMYTVITQ